MNADDLRRRIYGASELSDLELAELAAEVARYLEEHPDDGALAEEASIVARVRSGRLWDPLALRDRERPI